MPGMGGLELARAIRVDRSLGTPPLVMLSSVDTDEETALEAGVGYFLTRPVRQSRLYDCLVSAMRGKIVGEAAQQAEGTRAKLYASILLVEDNPVNQELARHMLEFLGCRCIVAADGREALAALERDLFDAALMDCEMPVMDGFEATAAIRRREAAAGDPRLPILALTAGAVEGDREKCLAAGMDDYLSKPFSLQQLEHILRRWLPGVEEEQAPHVDAAVLENLLVQTGGGPDLLRSLIGAYLKDAPLRMAAIHDGMERRDPAAVARAAHAFKSSSANLGAMDLAVLCRKLEAHCRAGTTQGAEPLVAEIHEECTHVAADLTRRARETTA